METGVIQYAPLRIRKNETRAIYFQKENLVATGVNGVVSYTSLKHSLKVCDKCIIESFMFQYFITFFFRTIHEYELPLSFQVNLAVQFQHTL